MQFCETWKIFFKFCVFLMFEPNVSSNMFHYPHSWRLIRLMTFHMVALCSFHLFMILTSFFQSSSENEKTLHIRQAGSWGFSAALEIKHWNHILLGHLIYKLSLCVFPSFSSLLLFLSSFFYIFFFSGSSMRGDGSFSPWSTSPTEQASFSL